MSRNPCLRLGRPHRHYLSAGEYPDLNGKRWNVMPPVSARNCTCASIEWMRLGSF